MPSVVEITGNGDSVTLLGKSGILSLETPGFYTIWPCGSLAAGTSIEVYSRPLNGGANEWIPAPDPFASAVTPLVITDDNQASFDCTGLKEFKFVTATFSTSTNVRMRATRGAT